MKKIIFLLLSVFAGLTSCTYDNYDEPDVSLQGQLTYDGKPLYVRNNQVTLRLYEPGWELSASTYMTVNVAQDGTFKASVYKGKTYKLVRLPNGGPWVDPTVSDTITLTNYNGAPVTMEVKPYFIIQNDQVTCQNKVVNASCSIKEITAGKQIEKVGLYVSRNYIVDNTYAQLGSAEISVVTVGKVLSLSVDLSNKSVNSTPGSLPSTGIIYARLGLKVNGIDAMLYTAPVELKVN